jgi:hypothetical protein
MTNNPILDVLTREGVLINCSVRYWRGHKKLKPEDLGLSSDQAPKRFFSLGQKRLLPEDAFAALELIEGRVHSFIESNTFPFLNGLAHFCPNTKLQQVHRAMQSFEAEFYRAKGTVLELYPARRQCAVLEWNEIAQKLGPNPERLVQAVDASFPDSDRLARSFGFQVTLFQLTAPESLNFDVVSWADQQGIIEARQRAAQNAAEEIRHQVNVFVQDCITSLRSQTAQLCDEMLQSIRTSKTGVHQKTLNRLAEFITQFGQLNFANDAEMEQRLNAARNELLSHTAEHYRESGLARQRLVSGLEALRDQARQLAQQDAAEMVARFGELGRRKFNLAA